MTSTLMGTVFGLPQIYFAPEDGGAATPEGSPTTPAASEGATTPPEGSPTTPVTPEGNKWYSGLPNEDQGWLQNRGLHEKDVNAAVTETIKSYRNLESRIGVPADRLLKLPEKLEGDEMAAVYNRLGRPEKAEGYDLKAPENVELNDEFVSWAKGAFHAAGLNQTQAQEVLSAYLAFEGGNMETSEAQAQEQATAQEAALRKEWGNAYDQNVNAARRAARDLGVDAETIDSLEKAMGYDGVLKLFNNVAGRIMEPGFREGGSDNGPGGFRGTLTPQQALDKIRELKGDKAFVSKYSQGDAEAKRRMGELHRAAYPDDNQHLSR